MTTKADRAVNRTGVYLAVLQLVFTLGWTTYLIYLPKLCADVGIAPSTVILILMMDQGIFTVTDTAMGMAADRISSLVGRLGLFVGILAAISCAAFIALPYVAGTGPGAKVWLIVLIVIWAVTSSALRAPPLTLLGKYRAQPSVPFLAALAMLGYGIAGAVSPYLGVVLRNQDARLPFVLSGAVLLLTALAFSGVERRIAAEAQPARLAPPVKRLGAVPMFLIGSMVLLSLGYQLHFNINSAPFYLRFAKADELQWLMPVFWIGFNIAMFPASIVVKHRGGLIAMGMAGLLGAFALIAAEIAGSLNVLIVAQFMAGAAWGCMLMSAVSAALAIGETGAEGKVTGLVFSALALATFARMAAVAGGLQKMPDYAPLVHWAPVACWSVAGAGLLVIAASRLQRGMKSA
ncbi:MFS transporter [Bradyrhizobium pachyrhizi]|uniref:MFS transporter n=1 Tax=Bradyrhizobium pachyrhizi TaxID=280333 RepID=A0A844SVS6_9BRAD|nr:MFS transporter [Bradyrhizobium pachyrhizi]MVT70106.1 MFS transporter [Bradyrhizobium pachyrhizi]